MIRGVFTCKSSCGGSTCLGDVDFALYSLRFDVYVFLALVDICLYRYLPIFLSVITDYLLTTYLLAKVKSRLDFILASAYLLVTFTNRFYNVYLP